MIFCLARKEERLFTVSKNRANLRVLTTFDRINLVMETPENLSHKPIIHVKDYQNKDAQFSNETDARSLSIGFAQWDKQKDLLDRAISAKVWRWDENNNKWSRQSEELPVHRVLDLSILLIASLIKDENADLPDSTLGETIVPSQEDNFKYIYKYYMKNKGKFDPRVKELERLIKKFMEREKLK